MLCCCPDFVDRVIGVELLIGGIILVSLVAEVSVRATCFVI